jgi:Protein of unknown function (DUF1264)
MNRRDALSVLGAVGCGLGVGSASAADHGKPADHKMMAPLGNHHLHFCGIHVAKKDPKIQIITQHYCGMRGGAGTEMHQCLLYDSAEKGAKLLGVEYIISNELFQKLPEEEKKYWHVHTYEVLGGGLIAPGMAPDEEMTFMKALLTTWGKTWHTWPDPTTPVPMGEPMLMWSLTADGQEDAKVIAARDKEFGVTTSEIRKKRIEAIGYEIPRVPLPKSIDTIGRQWTATGEDKPTPRKK